MTRQSFDILLIGQSGRVGYEALLCVASLRAYDSGFDGTIWVAEPQPGPLWAKDPRMPSHVREALQELDACIVPLENQHFGETYPIGNKIEALACLPKSRPFLFLDSDIFVCDAISKVPLDFGHPAASPNVQDTWPTPPLYGPSRAEIWQSVYDLCGVDIAHTLDHTFPPDDWRHYFYRNAGWFYGPCGPTFGERFVHFATRLRETPPGTLATQSLDPWLDQIALPVVLASFGPPTAPPDLDGTVLHHYRHLPLLFATGSDRTVAQLTHLTNRNRLKKHLKRYPPFHRTLYRDGGETARKLFDRARLPVSERRIRNTLRQAGVWGR